MLSKFSFSSLSALRKKKKEKTTNHVKKENTNHEKKVKITSNRIGDLGDR